MSMGQLELLSEALVELDEERSLEIAREALGAGVRSLALLQACERAMRVVGERYERQEYYLSALIFAGEIFRQLMDLARPGLEKELRGSASGTVVLGTVARDIHDIGKNIVATALEGFGFSVVDLGVDVSPERFLTAAREHKPDVIGLSGLISASYQSMKATVDLLRAHEDELGQLPAVVLGGEAVDEQVRSYVGADSWTTDAMEGVRICQRLVS